MTMENLRIRVLGFHQSSKFFICAKQAIKPVQTGDYLLFALRTVYPKRTK